MGNLVMPKNSAEVSEMLAVLEVYNDANGWMENADFIFQMKLKLGEPHQERQAYTKKTQIPSYFGFTEWESEINQSSRRITDSGKRFLLGLKNNDEQVIFEELLKALETRTFGRNVTGISSDSDIEPPQLFIKCTLVLGHLKRQEYGYILWQLDEGKSNILDLLLLISLNRLNNIIQYDDVPNTYADAKPITALVNWSFLQINGKEGGQDKIVINPKIVEQYSSRLRGLNAFNTATKNQNHIDEDDENLVAYQNAKNIIFYGPPGTGKSFNVNSLLASKESRTQRVTFHPEYDYASFVGSYKPSMSGSEDQNNDIRYEFVPQIFTKIYVDAWNDLNNDYYLVIEEINRGNCSEIFGDIFQLLDRKSNYPVTPSNELRDYLSKHLDKNKAPIDKLILPPNLALLATMNTSDQSLFPMDSAFKRRWDWEYVPIDYEISANNISSKFKVQVAENEFFSWIEFIQKVNFIIKNNNNLGMDKCIGNYFVKPENGIIDNKTFINKVLFYLWNDVFKDEMEDESIFKGRLSYEDFFPVETNGINKVREILNNLDIHTINS